MIKDFEFYHGAALSRIVHKESSVSIKRFNSEDNSAYLINDLVGLYIKYSANRLTPWRFTFLKEHREIIQRMKEVVQKLYIALVCFDDGICCIDYEEYTKLISGIQDGSKWISADRSKREEYQVNGSDGYLRYKIARSHFPSKIFEEGVINEIQM